MDASERHHIHNRYRIEVRMECGHRDGVGCVIDRFSADTLADSNRQLAAVRESEPDHMVRRRRVRREVPLDPGDLF